MPDYTVKNIEQVENMASEFGLPSGMQAQFASSALDLKQTGISRLTLEPDFRVPFGHKHVDQEELYLVVDGSARIKLDDEVVELERWDAIRVPGDTMRCLQAGPDGAQVVAFGIATGREDSEMVQNWWDD